MSNEETENADKENRNGKVMKSLEILKEWKKYQCKEEAIMKNSGIKTHHYMKMCV